MYKFDSGGWNLLFSPINGEDVMPTLGGWEWVIILVIVLLIFGVGRVGKLGEELGKGVRAFRVGIKDDGEGESDKDEKGDSDE
jgi:sec-independent protein translocase protein TatA